MRRKQTRRKVRRAMEQKAVEALYWLCEVQGEPTTAIMQEAIEDYGRTFRCPRCMGQGDDPQQPPRTLDNPMGEPPDPCGLCNGYGTVGPGEPAPPFDEDDHYPAFEEIS